MNLLDTLEFVFTLVFIPLLLGSAYYFTGIPLFRQSQQAQSTWSSRTIKATWKIVYIVTGNLFIQWFLPLLSFNQNISFNGVALYELYKIGLYLWILFITTPILGSPFSIYLTALVIEGLIYFPT